MKSIVFTILFTTFQFQIFQIRSPPLTLHSKIWEFAFSKFGIRSVYYEKFKLIESRWEVNKETGRPEKSYRTFYNAFQISTSLTFDETQELLTVVLMPDKEFIKYEAKIVELIGEGGTFANDVGRDIGVSSLTLKGLVRRSVKFDFKGHNIVPLKEEE